MDYPIDVTLFPSRDKYQHAGAFPSELSPPEGRFLLVFVASGLTRGRLRLADGQTVFEASGKVYEGVLLLVPHGAVFENTFDEVTTEASALEFACPSLRLNPARRLCYVMAAKGGRGVSFQMARRMSTYDIAVLRPLAERVVYASGYAPGSARLFRGGLILQALLGHLVQVPPAKPTEFYDDPRLTLYHEIEAWPRAFKVEDVARRTGQTQASVRKSFKRAYGVTPQQMKTDQSLHLARYYILNTKSSFKRIALRLGFSSASYFTQFIRRETGKTPRDIRASGKFQKREGKRKRGRGSGETKTP